MFLRSDVTTSRVCRYGIPTLLLSLFVCVAVPVLIPCVRKVGRHLVLSRSLEGRRQLYLEDEGPNRRGLCFERLAFEIEVQRVEGTRFTETELLHYLGSPSSTRDGKDERKHWWFRIVPAMVSTMLLSGLASHVPVS